MKLTKLLKVVVIAALTFSACKKDETTEPCPTPGSSYSIPAVYNFTNVDYSGQTTRLNMLEEMTTLMKTGNTGGTFVSETVLKNMFSNTGSPFTDANLNSSTKQIKSKTFSLDQTLFESFMDSLALASQSTVAGGNGTAGVVVSTTNSSKKYLLDEKGQEFTQIIEKGLMGAFIFYQIADNYLSDVQIGDGVDNTIVTPGKGTDMEHHWDEAFGYFGVPDSFPLVNSGARFIGKYCNDRDGLMGASKTIMDAYLKGRAAISNKDGSTRDTQRDIVRTELERVFAATAIHYLNAAKADFADDALRCHALSEFVGFTRALKYSPVKKITTTQLDMTLGHVGNNFYTITTAQIDNARDLLSTVYSLDAIKTLL